MSKRRLQVQVLSDMAVCEDLRELCEEVDGVRLRSKRSSTSFRLELFNCDSESWVCHREKKKHGEGFMKPAAVHKFVLNPLGLTLNIQDFHRFLFALSCISPCLLLSQEATPRCPALSSARPLLLHIYTEREEDSYMESVRKTERYVEECTHSSYSTPPWPQMSDVYQDTILDIMQAYTHLREKLLVQWPNSGFQVVLGFDPSPLSCQLSLFPSPGNKFSQIFRKPLKPILAAMLVF